MTVKLYDNDSHLKQFEANVISCEEYGEHYAVILDRTVFFPEAGGQESDRGTLENSNVLDVQINEENIIHITDYPLPCGSRVLGNIDWNRRFDFMQQHSGEHIVSGVAHKIFGCENVGFHLSEDIVTLDFDKPLKRDEIKRIEKMANEAVFANHSVFTYYPDSDTLSNLEYRSKKELEGDIRIVEVENTDICACCAPHVSTTGEIGIIKLLGTEALRGGVRIEMKCGQRALEDYSCKYENAQKISSMLCVKQNEIATAVEKAIENASLLKNEITDLKRKIVDFKVKAFSPQFEITAEFEKGLDIKELQHYADALYNAKGGIRGVFSESDDGFSFAICGDAERLDSFFRKFKENFTVKGGGRNGMVQGSVFSEKSEIEKFFLDF